MSGTLGCTRQPCPNPAAWTVIWRCRIGEVIKTGEPIWSPIWRGVYCTEHRDAMHGLGEVVVMEEAPLNRQQRRHGSRLASLN